MRPSVVAEIRSESLAANLSLIRSQVKPGVELCVAVKADAYGHGIRLVLPILEAAGIERIAVAQLQEAVEARELGWRRPILCLGAPLAVGSPAECRERASEVVARMLQVTVSSLGEARLLADEARRQSRPASVQLKVDSGMGRMGLAPEDAMAVAGQIADLPGIHLAGVYTHFATADEPDLSFAREQLSRFERLAEALHRRSARVCLHAANSAAIFCLPGAHFDMVRPGLATYGYWGGEPARRPAGLRPILRVVSSLAAVRPLPEGHAIGYGCTFRTTRASRIGVVPIGYADGYRRSLGNSAEMILPAVRGRGRAVVRVVGRVSMDLVTLDVTDVPDVQAGDPVIVMDDDPASPNSVEALARTLGTIPYEMTCLLGQRVERILV